MVRQLNRGESRWDDLQLSSRPSSKREKSRLILSTSIGAEVVGLLAAIVIGSAGSPFGSFHN
jgi:hypothetical protein